MPRIAFLVVFQTCCKASKNCNVEEIAGLVLPFLSDPPIQQVWNTTAFFFGVSIYMYMDDHGVPHCHAMYGDYAGSFSIENGECLAGQMPPNQAKKIKSFILDTPFPLKK